MKKKISVALGLAVLASPAFAAKEMPQFERVTLGEWQPVTCKSCGINLNALNTKDGHECLMCAIPMANNNASEIPGIISTHW